MVQLYCTRHAVAWTHNTLKRVAGANQDLNDSMTFWNYSNINFDDFEIPCDRGKIWSFSMMVHSVRWCIAAVQSLIFYTR